MGRVCVYMCTYASLALPTAGGEGGQTDLLVLQAHVAEAALLVRGAQVVLERGEGAALGPASVRSFVRSAWVCVHLLGRWIRIKEGEIEKTTGKPTHEWTQR
jgi:hypothetical protein